MESLNIPYGFDAISLMPTDLSGSGDNFDQNNSHVLPALLRRFDEAAASDARASRCGTVAPQREFLELVNFFQALRPTSDGRACTGPGTQEMPRTSCFTNPETKVPAASDSTAQPPAVTAPDAARARPPPRRRDSGCATSRTAGPRGG
ncbi:MAG TPA: NAD-dependent epimerase/dehydratase family protein [Immundisolibacter sp.]|nr:NAD-dependent epimerase/dehydratase family protein [Immundisolibacter sp.]